MKIREIHCYRKLPAKDDKCDCCFLNCFIAKSTKKVTVCVTRNVMSGTTKYALVRETRCIHLWLVPLIRIVRPSDRNCAYGGAFSIICTEIFNFYNYNIKKFNMKNLTFIQLHRTCFNTDTSFC
jgi:hypothetical protein